jgi:hypothetical protein
MTRTAVVLARPPVRSVGPPGVEPGQYGLALLEDTYEVVSDLAGVETLVASPAQEPWRSQVAGLLWPGTALLGFEGVADLFATLAERSASVPGSVAVLVVGDVPDLPGLVLAKVFAALENAPAAAAPALRGGLVALGVRLPAPSWLMAAGIDPDQLDAQDLLRSAAPRRGLRITAPWRRMRAPSDLASLDPGLEGWAATRTLLTSRPH